MSPTEEERDLRVEQLESLLVEVKASLEEKKDSLKPAGILKWIQGIVALVIVVVGLGVSYGVTTTKMSVLEVKVDTYQELLSSQMLETEKLVHELQLKQARDDALLTTIQSDIKEIKQDIKALIDRKIQ